MRATKRQKQSMKEWRLRNREKLREYDRNRRTPERLEYLRGKAKERSKKQMMKIRNVLGDKCVFCGSKENICYHEIYGKKHVTSKQYILEHLEDFVPLCYGCHRGTHFCMKQLKLTWKQISKIRDNL